jgi:hypothetical protein
LAPIAIVVVIAVAVLIVQGELGSKHHAHSRPVNEISGLVHRGDRKAANFYVVRSGDSLSSISVRTGVTVATLESLNPGVDPAALQAGQRLRLHR